MEDDEREPTTNQEEHQSRHDVGNHQRPDEDPHEVEVVECDARPRLDAEHDECAEHDRHAGTARDAKEQCWQKRAAFLRVVGGLRRDDTLDGAFAEALGGLRALNRMTVTHPGGHVPPKARDQPDDGTNERRAQRQAPMSDDVGGAISRSEKR